MRRSGRWDVVLVIAVGGALGSLARWGLTVLVPRAPGDLPVATWAANTTGALAIGVLMVVVTDVVTPGRYLRPFLGIGVLGGYTTFSTYMAETLDLAMTGQTGRAAEYLLGTLATGLPATWLGLVLARGAVERWRGRGPHPEPPGTP